MGMGTLPARVDLGGAVAGRRVSASGRDSRRSPSSSLATSGPFPFLFPALSMGLHYYGYHTRSSPPRMPTAHANPQQAQLYPTACRPTRSAKADLVTLPVGGGCRVADLLHLILDVIIFVHVIELLLPLYAMCLVIHSPAIALDVAHPGRGGDCGFWGVTVATMHILLVLFQGESFYQTSHAPQAALSHRWLTTKPKVSDLLAHCLDYSCTTRNQPCVSTAVHLLRRSMAFDSTTSLSPSYHYPPHHLPSTFSSHLLAPGASAAVQIDAGSLPPPPSASTSGVCSSFRLSVGTTHEANGAAALRQRAAATAAAVVHLDAGSPPSPSTTSGRPRHRLNRLLKF
uniref:Uncharacterized protein n=1 Tax=Oryza sativa subsp. japonica TaxID=39947 RepID=Q6Z2C5_ORYSJ|nr:hypothetical protein [Oryza sativa Japonica Group]BAD01364.1 hypothetical protein [Oryza sativa Japonica Group]